MHSTRHDPDPAALRASSSLPGHVLDVVVLTADESLLATLRDASGPEHALWRAASADAAVDLLVGGRCGVLIADLGALRGDVVALIERLHAQFPELVLLATGRRDEEGVVTPLVSKGVIYRFLHKPVSPARAGLFISAATRRYQELRDLEPIALTTVRTIAARPHIGKIVAGALAFLVVLIAFVVWNNREPGAPTVAPHVPVRAPTAAEQIADLTARAQIALATGRLAEPRGDNALEYYRQVLALQPEHAEASAGVERVIAALEQRFGSAINARNAAAGATTLASLQRADPQHPRLRAMRAELLSLSRGQAVRAAPISAPTTVARTAPAQDAPVEDVDAAAANASSAPQLSEETLLAMAAEEAELDDETGLLATAPQPPPTPDPAQLAQITELRMRGALISPAGANAYDALIELLEQFPTSDELRSEQQRIAFGLLERSRTALAAEQLDEAALLLERADSLIPGMSATRVLMDQLAKAQTARAFATNVVQAATLKRVREVAPSYPRDAQRRGVEGWVDVEFTIAPDGSTQDLAVRGGQPPEVFERAAIESVRRWRFEPIVRNGEAVAQRAILRVRFTLD